ncbi:carbohydrate-binding module family 18 protein, partial [Dothidotthia symphoricarpi CBS 119687]
AAAISKDARCGHYGGGKTCLSSGFGDCCSRYGYCGSNTDHCSTSKGCQPGYGTC